MYTLMQAINSKEESMRVLRYIKLQAEIPNSVYRKSCTFTDSSDMDSALTWYNAIVDWVGSVLPRHNLLVSVEGTMNGIDGVNGTFKIIPVRESSTGHSAKFPSGEQVYQVIDLSSGSEHYVDFMHAIGALLRFIQRFNRAFNLSQDECITGLLKRYPGIE